jgi:hypothetical protein
MTTYLFLGLGIWCLYLAWRGVVPDIWNPGGKLEIGQPMRSSTRTIFWAGGAVFVALGLLFLWEQWLKRLSAAS